MKTLVTGSSGHLGEALVRTLRDLGRDVIGLDRIAGPFTTHVGSINNRACVAHCMHDARVVFHAATLHKPHVATHSRADFVDTNITGTLNRLEEAVTSGLGAFVYTSTTSVFGDALVPAAGRPSAWITEDIVPTPRNIYGVTKEAAENLCQLFQRNQKLACIVVRASRFFPEADDDRAIHESWSDANAKANEFLFRRVDLEDVVSAHLLAAERAPALGFRRYIVSATTPYKSEDLTRLRHDAPGVTRLRVPEYAAEYARRGWRMFPGIDRVYVNELARRELGWRPRWDFGRLTDCLRHGDDW
jgi:UDP-glucose 4-epimerase